MGIVNVTFRTITCNGPECKNTVTYESSKEKETIEAPENAWVNGLRTIQTLDQRMFTYCSDVCEIGGVKTGQHNKPEPKKIVDTSGAPSAQIAEAAAAAKAAEEATKQLKAGPQIVR